MNALVFGGHEPALDNRDHAFTSTNLANNLLQP
jgi:hypothetical protein